MDAPQQTCILVAEADVLVRNLIGVILQKQGHQVLAAATKEEALALSRGFPRIDLVLSSLGIEYPVEIGKERPEMRIIRLSAATCFALREFVAGVGPRGFGRQECLPRNLAEKIQQALTDSDFPRDPVEV
jgi:CheY-like chemotaxis protein